MVIKNKKYVLKKVKEEDVRFIRLWFTDILGFLKSVTIINLLTIYYFLIEIGRAHV